MMRSIITCRRPACRHSRAVPPAQAQTFPTRPIKLVVPFAAGSATDTLARVLGQKLSAAEGWTVLVENIVGASGIMAAQNVARAAADGHTCP